MGRPGIKHASLSMHDDGGDPPSKAPFLRPRTRGECKNGLRPCPFVGCRYHLFLEVSKAGYLKSVTGATCPTELDETCALDVADRAQASNEPPSLNVVGQLLGITRERVRQIEEAALARVRSIGLRSFWRDLGGDE